MNNYPSYAFMSQSVPANIEGNYNFSGNDTVFARINCFGFDEIHRKFTGVSSMEEVRRLLASVTSSLHGFVKLTLRNFTQGWSREYTYFKNIRN